MFALSAAHLGARAWRYGLLYRVCTAATRTLTASGSGISMMTEAGARGVYAASDPLTEQVEEQVARDVVARRLIFDRDRP